MSFGMAWANKRTASFQFLNIKRRNAMRKRYLLRIAYFIVAWALVVDCIDKKDNKLLFTN